jgi:hypothetical protein
MVVIDGSWIYIYYAISANQCLSPQMLLVWIPLSGGILETALCDKVCQWIVAA